MINNFENFITNINQINRSIQAIKNSEMEKYGLKGTHVMCLYYLKQHKEGLTSKELTALCGEDKAAISRTLSKLESKGLVKFTDIEGKKRYRTIITLTDQGSNICEVINNKISEIIEISSEKYSDEDRTIFYRMLSTVSNNLQTISDKK